jgi:hypothetical protein
MLKLSMQDLIIRLDEQREVFQMLTPKRGGSAGELQVFYEVSEEDIVGDESVEDQIGKTIFAYLSARYASNSFGLDRYRDAGMKFAESMGVEENSLLTSGDADSEFEGALLRIRRFDESWTEDDIDGITALIELASNRGSKQAAEFLLREWPTRAAILRKRIQRVQKGTSN